MLTNKKNDSIIQNFFDSAINLLNESKKNKLNKFKIKAINRNIEAINIMKSDPKKFTSFKERYANPEVNITKDGFVINKDDSVYSAFICTVWAIDDYYNKDKNPDEKTDKLLKFISSWQYTKSKSIFKDIIPFGFLMSKSMSTSL
ncbi:MAG: hypothetical protein JW985_03500 [Alphaproteobacteria bacterium]|nr:hypothetical protein [Alphaproteobacteria bacterium]